MPGQKRIKPLVIYVMFIKKITSGGIVVILGGSEKKNTKGWNISNGCKFKKGKLSGKSKRVENVSDQKLKRKKVFFSVSITNWAIIVEIYFSFSYLFQRFIQIAALSDVKYEFFPFFFFFFSITSHMPFTSNFLHPPFFHILVISFCSELN